MKSNIFWTTVGVLGSALIFGLMFYQNGVLTPLLEGDVGNGFGLIGFFIALFFGTFAIGAAIVYGVVFTFVAVYRHFSSRP